MVEMKKINVIPTMHEKRVDIACLEIIPNITRSKIQTMIESGDIKLNGHPAKKKQKVYLGDVIYIDNLINKPKNTEYKPQNIKLNILFEDDDILVINKPANFVVHPGAGNHTGTLLNALLYHQNSLTNIPRAGIVHRLDKDTTGIMVVAKNITSYYNLCKQFAKHTVIKKYQAIVQGEPVAGRTITNPIGRHHADRLKFAIKNNGKTAETNFIVKEKFDGFALLEVQIKTGRTHQIRVHLSSVKLPILGDKTYKARLKLPKAPDEHLKEALRTYPQQALHAYYLQFTHPTANKPVSFVAPINDIMKKTIKLLQNHNNKKNITR
jgi:23S rRNA pseudouridine1911/1915/1917 synthase